MPSLKEGFQPFIVVNLRIKKENSDVRADKTVIRLGTEVEYQVFEIDWTTTAHEKLWSGRETYF